MQAAITLPELGAGPARVSAWFADVGELVFSGDRLVEVLVNGATFDVAAPATGRLLRKDAWPRETVVPGQLLGMVELEETI
jgi:pyruvate/2-oxoglutarate dehydrogenase complex dihydrolipoamide acyltransferase (E2) component